MAVTKDEPKKTKRKKQWQVTLDAYHRFVVLKYKNVLDVKKSEGMARMIEQWVVDHAEIAEKAGASFEDWMEQRDTWKDDEND